MLWRLLAFVGGGAGLGSLVLPYAEVTAGLAGLELQHDTYTLYQLAQLLEEAGSDPEGVYLIILLVVLGSSMAIFGAFLRTLLAVGGGLVQAAAAAAFAYGAETEGSQAFFAGLGQLEMTFEVGFYVLVLAAVVTLSSLLVRWVTDIIDRDRPS